MGGGGSIDTGDRCWSIKCISTSLLRHLCMSGRWWWFLNSMHRSFRILMFLYIIIRIIIHHFMCLYHNIYIYLYSSHASWKSILALGLQISQKGSPFDKQKQVGWGTWPSFLHCDFHHICHETQMTSKNENIKALKVSVENTQSTWRRAT